MRSNKSHIHYFQKRRNDFPQLDPFDGIVFSLLLSSKTAHLHIRLQCIHFSLPLHNYANYILHTIAHNRFNIHWSLSCAKKKIIIKSAHLSSINWIDFSKLANRIHSIGSHLDDCSIAATKSQYNQYSKTNAYD